MKFYEVFMELLESRGTRIGRSSRQLKANGRFEAAVKAEMLTDLEYDGSIFSHARKVVEISDNEVLLELAA